VRLQISPGRWRRGLRLGGAWWFWFWFVDDMVRVVWAGMLEVTVLLSGMMMGFLVMSTGVCWGGRERERRVQISGAGPSFYYEWDWNRCRG